MNQFIQANELRILDQFNKQVGVMTKSEALQKANELGVDLVEIAPKAVPPVAKLIDFAKFKYQLAQKAQEDKKKTKISDIKELRFTPVIAQGDFDARMKRARKFLLDGDKVRLNLKFAGRMITKKELGERVLRKAVDQLADISMIEIQPKLVGKFMMMQLSPVKKVKPGEKKAVGTVVQSEAPKTAEAPQAVADKPATAPVKTVEAVKPDTKLTKAAVKTATKE